MVSEPSQDSTFCLNSKNFAEKTIDENKQGQATSIYPEQRFQNQGHDSDVNSSVVEYFSVKIKIFSFQTAHYSISLAIFFN